MNTKSMFLLAGILLCAAGAAAQAPKIYRMPLAESATPPSYLMPLTTVKVKLTVAKETIRTGPYARYSQKYLGVMAPLSDRETYSITKAEIDYSDPDRDVSGVVKNFPRIIAGSPNAAKATSHVVNSHDFTKALPDRTSLADKSTEEMAREAANTIYTLRKRRFDLLTGEAGENVYGQGMQAAIKEMARIENEYLALFLGKHTVTTIEKEYDIVPQEDKTSYLVCRFTAEHGLMPDSDLSGQPVVLLLAPEDGIVTPPATKSNRPLEYHRVADYVNCRLMEGTEEFVNVRIPVYQFGKTIVFPAPAAK